MACENCARLEAEVARLTAANAPSPQPDALTFIREVREEALRLTRTYPRQTATTATHEAFERIAGQVASLRAESASLAPSWERAALLKDRTRQAIRDRLTAGELIAALATDYGVPEAFIEALGAWQMGESASLAGPTPPEETTR